MKRTLQNITILLLIVSSITFAQSWIQIGNDIDGEAAGDQSGQSVSLSSDGSRVAIGAWGNDGGGSAAGHVRIYSESGGIWTQVGGDIDGEAADDQSGSSVSLSSDGRMIAIGAPLNDGTGSEAGHVRVYSESGGIWTQVGGDIDGEAAGDYSGFSVSLSSEGDRVAIGAYNNDGTDFGAGHVRVYSESGGVWTQLGNDIDGEAKSDQSGCSVSLSSDGKRIAIGAWGNDGTGFSAGHVRVYSESVGIWTQVGSDIDGETAGDNSGISVALSSDGSEVAIGARYNDGTASYAGHVRVYSESVGIWTQVGNDIDGEAEFDYSGSSVAISADGNTVVIGAYANNGYVGHARVYSELGGVWTQLGSDIDGESEFDYSGISVALSSDGKRVAIGATGNDGPSNDTGHTRIYKGCINGSIIYNTETGKFNFCENGIWVEK